jgi:hypothetical protein
MIQELRTIVIVVSATLAALFVHHALEQAEALAATISRPALQAEADAIPVFQ